MDICLMSFTLAKNKGCLHRVVMIVTVVRQVVINIQSTCLCLLYGGHVQNCVPDKINSLPVMLHLTPFISLPYNVLCYPFPKRQILDSSKLKEFADDNFKFDENGRKLF